MPDAVEAELSLSAEDMVQGMAAMPENTALARFLWPLAAVALFVPGFKLYQSGELTPQVGAWLVIAGLSGVLIVTRRFAARRQSAALAREAETIRYRFDGEGLCIQTPLSDVSIRYPALHRFVEGPSFLLLYTQANIAQIVPTRAFRAEQLELIRGWLRQGVVLRQPPKQWPQILIVWMVLVVIFLLVWTFIVP